MHSIGPPDQSPYLMGFGDDHAQGSREQSSQRLAQHRRRKSGEAHFNGPSFTQEYSTTVANPAQLNLFDFSNYRSFQ